MEYNNSLSARIKRRNKQGFIGLGTGHMFEKDGTIRNYNTVKLARGEFGNYLNPYQNHKASSFLFSKRRKNYNRSKETVSFTKKYADGKQKFSKIVKKVVKFVKDLLK